MFQRLESVLDSEIRSLGHPRAALLGFAVAVLAYNVLAVLKRSVEHAHRDRQPQLDVSTYYLALLIRSSYEGMLVALPAPTWQPWSEAEPAVIARRLLELAQRVDPRRVRTHKRGPKIEKPKGYVDKAVAQKHVSTARVLREATARRP